MKIKNYLMMILNHRFHFILIIITSIFQNEMDNLFSLMIPGIDVILCIAIERIYIGKSFNCTHSITQHYIELNLENYKNRNPNFQHDWRILLVSVILKV